MYRLKMNLLHLKLSLFLTESLKNLNSTLLMLEFGLVRQGIYFFRVSGIS